MKYEPGSTVRRSYLETVCAAVLTVVLILLLVSPAQAQESGAGDAAHFLRNGVGARARSMGGAFVAVANGITASVWNPAGLSLQSGLRLGGGYENQFGGLMTSQYVGGAYSEESWGVGVSWFNSDLYSVYFLSAAAELGGLSFGASGKLYNFAYNLQTAGGMGVDVGILFEIPLESFDIGLGLASRDIGWTIIHWHGLEEPEEDRVAWVTRVGAAVRGQMDFGSLMATADLELALSRPPNPDETDYLSKAIEVILDLGAEVAFQGLALRAGLADINFSETGGLHVHPTLGVGVQVMGVEVNAAWIPDPLGATYLLSAEFVL